MLRWGMQLALLGSIGCSSGVIVSSEPLPEIDDPPNQPFAPRRLEVRLVDADTLAPLDGIDVTTNDAQGRLLDSGRTGVDGRVVLDFENGAFMNALLRVPSTAWRRTFTTFVPENMSAIERHIRTHPAVDREGPLGAIAFSMPSFDGAQEYAVQVGCGGWSGPETSGALEPGSGCPDATTFDAAAQARDGAGRLLAYQVLEGLSVTGSPSAITFNGWQTLVDPILLTITGVPADVHDIRLEASASTPARSGFLDSVLFDPAAPATELHVPTLYSASACIDVLALATTGCEYIGLRDCGEVAGTSIAFDVGRLARLVPDRTAAPTVFAWQSAPEGALGEDVIGQQRGQSAEGSNRWYVRVPAALAGAVPYPELPAELVFTFTPVAVDERRISHTDRAEYADYAELLSSDEVWTRDEGTTTRWPCQ